MWLIYDILSFINNLTTTITEVAWAVFALAWIIGWLLRGSPIPFRFKRIGGDIIEDAIIAAFFVAAGATIFDLVRYLGGNL